MVIVGICIVSFGKKCVHARQRVLRTILHIDIGIFITINERSMRDCHDRRRNSKRIFQIWITSVCLILSFHSFLFAFTHSPMEMEMRVCVPASAVHVRVCFVYKFRRMRRFLCMFVLCSRMARVSLPVGSTVIRWTYSLVFCRLFHIFLIFVYV